jgi:hypothetical protein
VRSVGHGFGAGEVWQCTNAGEEDLEEGTGRAAVVSQGRVECRECSRTFSRQGDLKRHRCLHERRKPVQEQRGSVQCKECLRWFKSAGGLSMHRKRIHTNK